MDDIDYKDVAKDIISLNVKYYNTIGNGYKYFKPKGVVRVYSKNYNDILKRTNNYYYLYVDVVSYYYKTNQKISNKESNLYYYDKLSNKNKNGYLKIKKMDNDGLFVILYYNYSKIQCYTDEENLKQAILDMSYIVSSMNFNDSLLKKMYEKGELSSKDEVFKLFDNKNKEGNFLEYIKEYDKYDETEESEEIKLEVTTTKSTTTESKKEETTTKDNKKETTTTSSETTTTSSN